MPRVLPRPTFSIGLPAAILLFVIAPFAHAQKDALQEGDRVMATMGNWPTEFIARCPAGQQIAGFDLQTGNDLRAIQPICVTALAPATAGPFEAYPTRFGGTGSGAARLVCPTGSPVVTKMGVQMEPEVPAGWGGLGALPERINGILLHCGLVDRPQGRHVQGAQWLGPLRSAEGRSGLSQLAAISRNPPVIGYNTCADNLVAVGISGRATTQVDSVGLICGEPTLTEGPSVRAQGRVKGSPEVAANRRPLPICEAARGARARNSPAAPGLEARCKAEGEQPPIDFDGLAAKGEAIASQDPLSVELRGLQPDGPARVGFDIGMAVAEGQTAPGPGKQRIQDALSPAEQGGFVFALAFSLDRNRNADLAKRGAAVAAADAEVARARAAEPDVLHRLGFDIASGLFGKAALGGDGNTSTGPGSLAIRNALSASVQSGFDDGMAFHLR